MQILSKEKERGPGGGHMKTHLIHEMILYSLYCTVTRNNIPEDEKQTPSPESTLKPKHLQEIFISLGSPTSLQCS